MDWSNSLNKSKFMSKIFRTCTAVRKRLAWYFMILSKNSYPIGKSSKYFKISAVLCVMMVANALYNIAMCLCSDSFVKVALYSFTSLLAAFAAWLNFNSCLRMKQQLYNEKVREASCDYSLPYEMAVIKLAALYPELELDKDAYDAWFNEWNDPHLAVFDFSSLYPAMLSTSMKGTLKRGLQAP